MVSAADGDSQQQRQQQKAKKTTNENSSSSLAAALLVARPLCPLTAPNNSVRFEETARAACTEPNLHSLVGAAADTDMTEVFALYNLLHEESPAATTDALASRASDSNTDVRPKNNATSLAASNAIDNPATAAVAAAIAGDEELPHFGVEPSTYFPGSNREHLLLANQRQGSSSTLRSFSSSSFDTSGYYCDDDNNDARVVPINGGYESCSFSGTSSTAQQLIQNSTGTTYQHHEKKDEATTDIQVELEMLHINVLMEMEKTHFDKPSNPHGGDKYCFAFLDDDINSSDITLGTEYVSRNHHLSHR